VKIYIQLKIRNHFQQRYFFKLIINNNQQIFLIEDELDNLKFLFYIQQVVESLFELYKQSDQEFEHFFVRIIQCGIDLKEN
jgi:hypothetical protein